MRKGGKEENRGGKEATNEGGMKLVRRKERRVRKVKRKER